MQEIVDDMDYEDMELAIPMKLDHNTSADFINIKSKKRSNNSVQSRSEGDYVDDLADCLNDLQEIGHDDNSEFNGAGCCLNGGGDSESEGQRQAIEELVNDSYAKDEFNLDSAIDLALGKFEAKPARQVPDWAEANF